MLIAPRLFLDVNLMGGVLIYSFAAATLGGFDSPFGAVVGGWIIGVAETLAGTYVDFIGSDLKILVPLVIILVVLLFRPTGLFGSRGGGAGMSSRARPAWLGAGRVRARRSPCSLPFFFGAFRVGQFTQVLALRGRGARAQPARRLQRPDLARPRRVLRARRLRGAI